jgi:ABC-type nitrate/sulfonate/bicarbonate transport system substrate-binding protein
LGGMICEACGKAEARKDDILCSDCSYYYGVLRDLLEEHPELVAESLDRIKEVFEWRMKKIRLVH